jgi:hypothetical protein
MLGLAHLMGPIGVTAMMKLNLKQNEGKRASFAKTNKKNPGAHAHTKNAGTAAVANETANAAVNFV